MEAWSVGLLDIASLEDSSTWTAPPGVIVAVFLVGLAVFMAALFIGEESAEGDPRWLWWLLCAWLTGGAAFALMSLVAGFWYVVATAGLALVGAVLKGVALLFEVAEDFPLLFGFIGAGIGAVCLAGAVVEAVTGHPWLALTALSAATWLTGMSAVLILEHGPYELTSGQVRIVAVTGGTVTALCGLALLVLGPLHALTTAGDVADRFVGGAVIAVSGWSGMWMASQVSELYDRVRPRKPRWER